MNANNNNQNNNIFNHREYNIINENIEYNLKLEIDNQFIYFILSKLNDSLDYNYKNKLDLISIIDKLELNPSKYSNLDLILNIFDKIYNKNKLLININDENYCNLLIKLKNIVEEEIINEIKLYKEYTNINDKFNIIYNKIKLNKENKLENNKQIENIKNEINNIKIDINKKEEEIKDKINKQDNNIKEINDKIINEENINELINKRIEEIENKLINNFK